MRATLQACVATLVGLFALAASGCAESTQASTPGAPVTTEIAGSSASVSPYAVDNPASPSIARPLVVAGVSACEAVTDTQLIELGLDPESKSDHSNAESADCRWHDQDGRLSAQLVLSNVRGLEILYYWRDTFSYFQPTEVAGYPAVRATSPDQGTICEFLVGVGPNRGVGVEFENPGSRDGDYCGLARRLGSMVVGNLQPE